MPSADTQAILPAAGATTDDAAPRGLTVDAALITNLASVGSIGVAGILLNIGVARIYGLDGLGVFSLALTIFLILGQLAAGGFAFSTLYHFSTQGPDHPDRRAYLLAMATPVFATGALGALGLWLAADLAAMIFRNERIALILPLVGLATLFFGLNKVVFMALNGMGHLKAFALLQGARLPLMLFALIGLVSTGQPVTALGWLFVASEVTLFLLASAVFILVTAGSRFDLQTALSIFRGEGAQGWRGFLIGLLADVNTRVDILVLSVFLTDRLVGVYAFGALLVDGLRMVPAAVQNVINPRLALLIAGRDQEGLIDLYRRLARYGRPVVFLLAAACLMFILEVAPGLMNVADNRQSALVFTAIALGLVAASPAIALDLTFSQAGAPGLQTRFFGLLVSTNLALNIMLVPWLGLIGAALATAFVDVLRWGLLHQMSCRHLGLRFLRKPS